MRLPLDDGPISRAVANVQNWCAKTTTIRADAVSVYYRRWLREKAITYDAIAARA